MKPGAFYSYSTAQIELDERLAVRICQGDGMTLEERQRAQYLIREAIRMRCDGPNVRQQTIEECASVCERIKDNGHWTDGVEHGAEVCAAAIRELQPHATGSLQETK